VNPSLSDLGTLFLSPPTKSASFWLPDPHTLGLIVQVPLSGSPFPTSHWAVIHPSRPHGNGTSSQEPAQPLPLQSPYSLACSQSHLDSSLSVLFQFLWPCCSLQGPVGICILFGPWRSAWCLAGPAM
jgi:hypothetical protein